ncbi:MULTISPECIES: GNAT family N-acetyltransferase [Bradyrhizobium]|uniref:GNAT family N-acetyltransferase n=1 Tax=Bradyrhizobium elkanii TaxID=29448 RepID=A0A4U6SA55_BRAEL|nr:MULTISPECIES: GNAT family N-acetyltransferase [Bradyrhizobium]MTV17381.1 N-acetyltransferase [Bradyrhizobium sp. BR2003]TKV81626.1 GNAT family N-acetyltransferase [Bradyrhizobium elkanii]
MVSLIKPGARLLQVDGPVIETARLILRPWRASDVAENTKMLSDPETARFITPDHQPVTSELKGWRNAAVISGHWALHGFGMFAVEEKSSGRYIGRVGPYHPPEWPGFEVGWGIAKEHRGKGYAVEAARAATDWVFDNFAVDRIIHCIDPANVASQAVARRLGAVNEGPGRLEGDVVDIWVTTRQRWQREPS